MYFPCITSRQAECQALGALADPTKDQLFPLIRLQAWPRSKANAGTPISRSIDHIKGAYSGRPFGVDLARPRQDLDTLWALQGREELNQLHIQDNGFLNWCQLVGNNDQMIPVIQWTDDPISLRLQVSRMISLGRGVIFRFRYSAGWNLNQLSALSGFDFGNSNVLLVFDCEQISGGAGLLFVAERVRSAILMVNTLIQGAVKTSVLVGSSFPASFADIDPEYSKMEIMERQLHGMIANDPPILAAGIDLKYGDHASVYASEREPAFRGAARVDYPTPSHWVYHRCSNGFAEAVQRLAADADWNDSLLCWGAQRIRTAIAGQLVGLGSQSPWVAIRLNIHMHLQAYYGGGAENPVEEEWID